MIIKENEIQYLEMLMNKLMQASNFKQAILTRPWANTIPSNAGVYTLNIIQNYHIKHIHPNYQIVTFLIYYFKWLKSIMHN